MVDGRAGNGLVVVLLRRAGRLDCVLQSWYQAPAGRRGGVNGDTLDC